MIDKNKNELPNHIGFILDGNRRWAKAQGKPSLHGHARGSEVLREIALETLNNGVKHMSAFLFSTENWSRPKPEVTYLMRLIIRFLEKYIQDFIDNEVKLLHIGSREGLPKSVLEAIDKAVERTKSHKRGTFGLCINYGGQQEILDAAKKILRYGKDPVKLTAKDIEESLYAPEMPPLDLVVRTSGEYRTSGFMLYRAAYAEYIFIDKAWPDFSSDDLKEVLDTFANRQRRFGR